MASRDPPAPERPVAGMAALSEALSLVRADVPEAEIQMVIAFLEVAAEPGISMALLRKRMGYAPSTNSRVVAALSAEGGTGGSRREAANLIEKYPDPDDGRVVLLRLTRKGHRLAESVGARLGFQKQR